MTPKPFAALVLLLLGACVPTWTGVVPPVQIRSGADAERIMSGCRQPPPARVDSLWTPDSAQLLPVEGQLISYLKSRGWVEGERAWVFDGDATGFFAAGHRYIFASFTVRPVEEIASRRTGPVWVLCDGGLRYFGITYDVEIGRIIRIDADRTFWIWSEPIEVAPSAVW